MHLLLDNAVKQYTTEKTQYVHSDQELEITDSQCENVKKNFSFRFYVKSILENLEDFFNRRGPWFC